MTKNEAPDTITDQEIAFVHLILSGTMTDERAAEAVGLNTDTAAYIKSKPCVRAYLLEHQARMQQKLAAQQTGSLPHFHLGREKVLDRLWEICIIGPEITRGSLTSQVKAISMIVAIEGLIPDRRAGSAQTNSPAPKAEIYESEWMEEQRLKAAALVHAQEAHKEQGLPVPLAEPAPGSPAEASPQPGPTVHPDDSSLTETQYPPYAAFPPDTRVPFSIKKNPFARRRF